MGFVVDLISEIGVIVEHDWRGGRCGSGRSPEPFFDSFLNGDLSSVEHVKSVESTDVCTDEEFARD